MKIKTRLLPKRFVSNWLLGTAIFVMGWSMYLAYLTPSSAWLFMGIIGGTLMLHLHAKIEDIDVRHTELFFGVFLTTLAIVAINMALASLGICEDTFGLLGGKG